MIKCLFSVVGIALIVGCRSSSKLSLNDGAATVVSWKEKENRSVANITFGIPAFDKTTVNYQKSGRTAFTIQLSQPQIITVAEQPEGWGFYQFPTITRLTDESLFAQWSMHPDDIRSYGTNAVGSKLSKDGAVSWQPYKPDSTQLTGFTLPNGDIIRVVDPKPIPVENLKLPGPVGKTAFRFRKTNFTFYRLPDMPEKVNGVFISRKKKGDTTWQLEEAKLDDPKAVRYSSKGLVPVVWWGDMHTMKDGSLVAGVYPGYYLKQNGEVDTQMGVVFYRSLDNGYSWKIQGRIPFQADRSIDSVATDRIGFSEPATELLADGSLLCVIRSADGDGVTNGVGNGPMYAARSTDMGVTWTAPAVIAPAGALPRLLRLQNGVTVLSSGRPGVQLRFTKTAENNSWTDACEMLPYESQSTQLQYLVSCGYTGLLATGPNRFLMIYSDFRYKNVAGEERKAIKIREVIIDPK